MSAVTQKKDLVRILIIEDMPSVRQWEKMILDKIGQFDIHEANDGQEALTIMDTLHKESQHIHLILCDWRMPELDGLMLFSEIKKYSYLKNIPFIMISAESDPKLILKVLENGVDHYITKPFSEKELQEKIDLALKKSPHHPHLIR